MPRLWSARPSARTRAARSRRALTFATCTPFSSAHPSGSSSTPAVYNPFREVPVLPTRWLLLLAAGLAGCGGGGSSVPTTALPAATATPVATPSPTAPGLESLSGTYHVQYRLTT